MIDVDAIVDRVTGKRDEESAQVREILADVRRGSSVLGGPAPNPVERVERERQAAQVDPTTTDEGTAEVRLARLVASRHGLPEDVADLLTGDLDSMTAQAERLAALQGDASTSAPSLPSRPQAALRPSSTREPIDPAAIAREVLADTGTRRHA